MLLSTRNGPGNNDGNESNIQHVLVFTGNGAICSNSQTTIHDIINLSFDYIAMPYSCNDGIGGDGRTHSLRDRNAMLDAIRYGKRIGKGYGYDGNERDDLYFVRTLLDMNAEREHEQSASNNKISNFYHIATKEQTDQFGGISRSIEEMTADEWPTDKKVKEEAEKAGPPLIVSGTLPKLGNAARELMLDLCPELKVIFPSKYVLHRV